MNVTIEQVAKRAGVTPGTVSRALRGEGASTLSRKTQLRVATIASQMGYEPNTSARMLATGKTNQVSAVYVNARYGPNKMDHAIFLETLAEQLGNYGYDLKIKCFRNSADVMTALPVLSKSRSCDAMVLLGVDDDVNSQGALLETMGFPFIARGRHEATHPNWIQTDFDHEGMMSTAINKLVGLGHRRIAYLGHVPWYTFSKHLFDGYISAMGANRLETDRAWHLLQDDTSAEGVTKIIHKLQTWPLLPLSQRPTAVACGAPAVWPVFQKALLRQKGYSARATGTARSHWLASSVTKP